MNTRNRLLIAVSAGLLVLVPAGVSAQDEVAAPAYFKVNQNSSGPPTEGEATMNDAGHVMSSVRFEDVAVDAGDPRASGVATFERNDTEFEVADGRMSIGRGIYHLINDDGGWTGVASLTLSQQDGPPTQLAMLIRLEGEGAYEGLILELHAEEPDENMSQVGWGVIYPADAVPPTPDTIE